MKKKNQKEDRLYFLLCKMCFAATNLAASALSWIKMTVHVQDIIRDCGEWGRISSAERHQVSSAQSSEQACVKVLASAGTDWS